MSADYAHFDPYAATQQRSEQSGQLYSKQSRIIQSLKVTTMFDSLSLESLLLAEAILILIIICCLLLIYALKQRELHRHILEEYRKLRLSISLGDHPAGKSDEKQEREEAELGGPLPAGDQIARYLAQANEQALDRFKKITHATIPRLGPAPRSRRYGFSTPKLKQRFTASLPACTVAG